VSLPVGWSEEHSDRDYDTANFTKTLANVNYRTSFQVLEVDPFRQQGRLVNPSLITEIKSKRGTSLYLVKDVTGKTADGHMSGLVYVSSCRPTQKLCTIPYGTKFLFIILYPWTTGSGNIQELDLDNPNTNTIVGEFTKLVESANL
jgi:hypothetical protein